jgi:hypothetical protein
MGFDYRQQEGAEGKEREASAAPAALSIGTWRGTGPPQSGASSASLTRQITSRADTQP